LLYLASQFFKRLIDYGIFFVYLFLPRLSIDFELLTKSKIVLILVKVGKT